MNKHNFYITLLLVFSVGITFSAGYVKYIETTGSFVSDIEIQPGSDYEKEWKEIDRLYSEDNLPKSALEKVKSLYERAKKEKNYAQIIRCVSYIAGLKQAYEEEGEKIVLLDIEGELQNAPFPAKQVLQSLAAEMYWQYYEQHRYEVLQREITVGFTPSDISTWNASQFAEKCALLYMASLSPADSLQAIGITFLDQILHKEKGSDRLRPTLYDFLAHRTLDFFTHSETGLLQPANTFQMNGSEYFSAAEAFVHIVPLGVDTSGYTYQAFRLFQSMLRYHIARGSKASLVDLDLKRLAFIYEHSVTADKLTTYEASLLTLEKKAEGDSIQANVIGKILQLWYDKALAEELPGEGKENYYKKVIAKGKELQQQYPRHSATLQFENLLMQITRHELQPQVEAVNEPGKAMPLLIRFKNVTQLHYRIIPSKEELRAKEAMWGEERNQFVRLLLNQSPVKNGQFVLDNPGDYYPHTAEQILPALSEGSYYLLVSETGFFSEADSGLSFLHFQVSTLSYLTHNRDGDLDVYVVARGSGRPIPKATVELWQYEYDYSLRRNKKIKIGESVTDLNGFVRLKRNSNRQYGFSLKIISGKSVLESPKQYSLYDPSSQEVEQQTVRFFLDRAIYRPGQTVYYKAIALKNKGKEVNPLPNRNYTITLRDANYEEVSRQELTTNDYGTLQGTFTLPIGKLTGRYTIQTTNGNHSFQVEEYKRPKFEAVFEPVEGDFVVHDNITVTGKAETYAGSVIDGAKVTYRVVRQTVLPWWCYWYRPYRSAEEMEILNGRTTTDTDGKFEVVFPAIPDLSEDEKFNPVFHYRVIADITDNTGETRTTETIIKAGYVGLEIELNLGAINGEYIERNKNQQFTLTTKNLNGVKVPAKGEIKIERLTSPEIPLKSTLWDKGDIVLLKAEEYKQQLPGFPIDRENEFIRWKREEVVWNRSIDTKRDSLFALPEVAGWKEGKYVMTLSVKDNKGKELRVENYFTVMDMKQGKMPYSVYDLFVPIASKVEPGGTATFLIGSSTKDVQVLFEVYGPAGSIKKEWIQVNQEKKLLEIPILESYRGGIAYSLAFVKDNRTYTHQFNIEVPYTNKALDLRFETFRNKLIPGSKEQWKIQITGHKKEAVTAELLASMYDASLDAFVADYWNFNPYPTNYYYSFWQPDGTQQAEQASYLTPYPPVKYQSIFLQRYDRLNLFLLEHYHYSFRHRNYGYAPGMSIEDAPMMLESISVNNVKGSVDREKQGRKDNEMSIKIMEATTADKQTKAGPPEEKIPSLNDQVVPRRKLQETAFFFPTLMTDEKGDVILSFEVPEALTRWNFRALAITQDLQFGQMTEQVVTQRDLMITPNAPRYFREGDKIVFTAKVANLSEKELSGTARLYLFDAFSNKPVESAFGLQDAEKKFTTASKQTTGISWELNIPEGYQGITYRVVATSGNLSDGEENALPVVTNRMLVTETLPLHIRNKQTKNVVFTKLKSADSPTLKHFRLTLEMTSNPAWYAVQSLPYLMEYPYECSEQVFSRYYANTIASTIANSNPRIKQVFDAWKNTDALISNLEKNTELKQVLLEETPYVFEARQEGEQKKRIALLFDINRMANEQENSLQKLLKMQSPNGGWPWFPGGPDDRYITQHIATGLAKLKKLNMLPEQSNVLRMQEESVRYLDNRIREDYEELKRWKADLKAQQIGYLQIQYLYMRSFYPNISIAHGCEEAADYYRKQGETYWMKQNRFMQGMIALALHRGKTGVVPQKIIASLKETAIKSEEMGMYWKENYTPCYWYEAPIESQALMIEVFEEVAADITVADELRVWLLKQKQTTNWKSTKATADACYALLMGSDDWLSTTEQVRIEMGGKEVGPRVEPTIKTEAGSGYYKTSWSGAEITPEMSNIQMSTQSNGVSWGAVYWQYFENLDKISKAQTGLSLERKYFRKIHTPKGPAIEPVTSTLSLQPGDLIVVRMEIRTDRNLEYVHLKDMRPAGFEPVNVLSGYRYKDGLGYYESTRDLAGHFFISWLQKGTYVFEYELRVVHTGEFSTGITSMQCLYAPEFSAHTEGMRIAVR